VVGEAVPFRIVVVDPPRGVHFRLQSGKSPGELLPPARSTSSSLTFEFELHLGEPLSDGRPRFLGRLTQGTPEERFVYVNSGTVAGQPASCWTRRAKVHLSSITAATVQRVLSSDELVLQAQFAGTAKDGGPACASVPLLEGAWHVVPSRIRSGLSLRSLGTPLNARPSGGSSSRRS
jgi:hypothetical protein